MFQVISHCVDTGLKSLPPLIDGLINDGLPKVRLFLNQTLFQLLYHASAAKQSKVTQLVV